MEPFWLRFGGHLEPNAVQKASQGTPRFWVSFWSQNGSQTGFFFFANWGPGGAPEPPWSRFAAGTLLDLNFNPFWLRLESQKHGLGPLAVPILCSLSNHSGNLRGRPCLILEFQNQTSPSFEKTPLRVLVVPACIVKHSHGLQTLLQIKKREAAVASPHGVLD